MKPPMATPSVQGSIKLAIKVGGGGGGGRNAAGDGSENAARAAPRMMTALPEDAETLDLHDDYLWMDGDDQLMGADVAAAAAIAATVSLLLFSLRQQLAVRAHLQPPQQ